MKTNTYSGIYNFYKKKDLNTIPNQNLKHVDLWV